MSNGIGERAGEDLVLYRTDGATVGQRREDSTGAADRQEACDLARLGDPGVDGGGDSRPQAVERDERQSPRAVSPAFILQEDRRGPDRGVWNNGRAKVYQTPPLNLSTLEQ